MKRRILVLVLSILLIAATVIAPVSASAASRKSVAIMKVTVNGARVRKGPSSNYGIITSVKKGAKVFYLGKHKKSFYLVRTSHGKVGYMYKGFLKSYGACYEDQIYRLKKSTPLFKKASTRSVRKVAKLGKGLHVIVYQTKGKWAYVKTMSGKGGYVKKKLLKKVG